MPFILRVDIDKPYGHHTLSNKVLSKLREDYYFPALGFLKYLYPTIDFLRFCNEYSIPTISYFRSCTMPNTEVKELLIKGNHTVGFHAEDTRSFDSFQAEFNLFKEQFGEEVHYFSKHGSGKLKLGRKHYPQYEPNKYIEWGKRLQIDYSFGNGIAKSYEDLFPKNKFYENMFWLERHYRDPNFYEIENVIEFAKKNVVVLVVHPSNFYSNKDVNDDLMKLFSRTFEESIPWLNRIHSL
jgi:hypothetical protein